MTQRTGLSAVLLMYHRLGAGVLAGREPGEHIYAVTADRFAAQLDAMARVGVTLVSPVAVAAAALDGSGLPARAAALTFDDGNSTDHDLALPELSRRGLRAAFFLSPALVGRPGYLDWDRARALAAAGMTIGAHGLDHRPLTSLDDGELGRHLREARRLLADQLGQPADFLSLPGGAGDARVLAAAADAGFRLVFDSVPRRFVPGRAASVPRFAVRAGDRAGHVAALAAQRPLTLLGQAVRHGTTRRLRSLLGEGLYQRARRTWAPGAPGSSGS